MSRFVVDSRTMDSINHRVIDAVGQTSGKYNMSASLCAAVRNCGCGAGGTCASSCVSGCAERGGCGPHGPK